MTPAGRIVLGIVGALACAAAAALAVGDGDGEVLSRLAPYRLPLGAPADIGSEIAALEANVSRDPTAALDRAALASLYLKKAKAVNDPAAYGASHDMARKSLELLPHDNPGAKMTLAGIAEARHDFPEARRLACEVLKDRPGHPEALALLVTAGLGVGAWDEALRAAEELSDWLPTMGSWTLLALALEARGRDFEASHAFHAAISAEDLGESEGSAWARALLARHFMRRGRMAEARDLLNEALRIVPVHPKALGLLAELEARQGRTQAAERLYTRAFQKTRDPHFLIDLAVTLAGRGDAAGADARFAEAESLLRQEIAAGEFGHRGELTHMLLHRGRPEDLPEALVLANEEARRRRDLETLENLAWALSRAGRWLEARAVVREAIASGARRPELYSRAAEVERALGNSSRAGAFEVAANNVH